MVHISGTVIDIGFNNGKDKDGVSAHILLGLNNQHK